MSATDCTNPACGQFHGIDPSTGRCTYCGLPRFLAEMTLRDRRDEDAFDLQIATQHELPRIDGDTMDGIELLLSDEDVSELSER